MKIRDLGQESPVGLKAESKPGSPVLRVKWKPNSNKDRYCTFKHEQGAT